VEYPLPEVSSVASLILYWTGQAAVRGAKVAGDEGGYFARHNTGRTVTASPDTSATVLSCSLVEAEDAGPPDLKPKLRLVARSTNAKAEIKMVR
jgi:hypothetical protein